MEEKKLKALIVVSLFAGSCVLDNYLSEDFDISKNSGGATANWEEHDDKEEGTVESVWDDNTGSYLNFWHTGQGYYMINSTPYMHQDADYYKNNPVYGKSKVMKKYEISKQSTQVGGANAIAEARKSGKISYDNPMRTWQGASHIIQMANAPSDGSGIGNFSNRSSSVGG